MGGLGWLGAGLTGVGWGAGLTGGPAEGWEDRGRLGGWADRGRLWGRLQKHAAKKGGHGGKGVVGQGQKSNFIMGSGVM